VDCSELVVFADDSPLSHRLISFLERAGCRGLSIKDYRQFKEEIIELEGGSSLVPLVWNKSNNKLMVGCPVTYEEFLERLEALF